MAEGESLIFCENDGVNGYYHIKSPWYACAMTVLCMFKFRNGPWRGRVHRDVAVLIAKRVYGQVQRPDAVHPVFYLYTRNTRRMDPQYARWTFGEWRAAELKFNVCPICERPRTVEIAKALPEWGCWVHGNVTV